MYQEKGCFLKGGHVEMKKLTIFLAIFISVSLLSAFGNDGRLLGPWKAVTSHIARADIPMEGLMIFTQKHFSSNVLLKLTKGPMDDANINAGLYETKEGKIIFKQWIQIHLRPGDSKEPIQLPNQLIEEASYKLEGNHLVITFPSKNHFILERIHE